MLLQQIIKSLLKCNEEKKTICIGDLGAFIQQIKHNKESRFVRGWDVNPGLPAVSVRSHTPTSTSGSAAL